MITLTPLQINDVKREGLDDYFRSLSIKFMYYDAIEVGIKFKHSPPISYVTFPLRDGTVAIGGTDIDLS